MRLEARDTHLIDGQRYVAVDRPLDRRLHEALARDASAVHVFNSEPGIESLDILLPWAAELRRLIVTDSSVRDFSAIAAFKRLQELDLFPAHRARGHLNVADLPGLTVLACRGALAVEWERSGLLELAIENLRSSDARKISTLQRLRRLKLSRPGSLSSQLPPTLVTLDLSHFAWPDGLSHLAGIDGLHELSLTRVSGLTTLEPFAVAQSLQRLNIEECRDLQSLRGVGLAPGVEPTLIGRKTMERLG